MRRAYVALTGLATLFYMAGYKIVKGEGVLPRKFKRKWGIPWYTTREHCIIFIFIIQTNWLTDWLHKQLRKVENGIFNFSREEMENTAL